jgi:hypothetical protein
MELMSPVVCAQPGGTSEPVGAVAAGPVKSDPKPTQSFHRNAEFVFGMGLPVD